MDVRSAIESAYSDPEFSAQLRDQYEIKSTQEPRNWESHYTPDLMIRIIQKEFQKFKSLSKNYLIYGYPFSNKVTYPLMTEVLSVLNNF